MAEPTNTPVPASTPRSASPVPLHPISANHLSPLSPSRALVKPRVLHIGDPVCYNLETYAAFSWQFEIIRPEAAERERSEFIKALKERRWGDFHAIFRPFWGTGGEMGRWDAELVDLLPPGVKLFASAGAGFDWADTELMGQRGIIYCNSGLAAAEAVADFAVAMVISTFRHLPWCISSAVSGDANEFEECHKNATAESHNLRGHVLGLIGLGNIGQQVATRCRHGFGMNIHYYDIERKPSVIESALSATFHPTLESLMRASDCVVLAAPSGQDQIINATSSQWFRPGSRFVNVARGSLVDEEALADALARKQISAVALDVHQNEPRVNERLRQFASQGRVMLTCHNAGGTVETHKGFEELSMRNIMAVLSDGQAITPVNLHHLQKQ
ncbi:Glyoxylate reductase [Paramyrothecium foliicola]|nr:Glyoxylate reductase [Paramyrothecium foliicola]